METPVFILDVLQSVAQAMKVPIFGTDPVEYFSINYQPGRDTQILEALQNMSGTTFDSLKYPLLAAVMPIQEKRGSFYPEVTFPRIVFAYLTKTNTGAEKVLDKYSSDGTFKRILRPCLQQFIQKLAWSTYTNMGDPDMYEYTVNEVPAVAPIGKGTNDFVDIIEILNLKATIFSKLVNC